MAIAERLTLEEFLALPEEEPSLEYEDGRVTQKVSPMGKHSMSQVVVADLFNAYGRPKRLSMALTELRSTYAGYSRVPDVSVYRWDRIPVDESGEIANNFRDPPDIAIEIVSPGQSVNYLVRRCLWYVDNGALAALLLDPSDESVLLIRPNQPMVGLRGPDQIDLQDILPGFQLTVEAIFDALVIRPKEES